MHDGQVAQARNNTYRLFSHLFLHGLTAELRPFVEAISELAAAVPGDASNADDDQAAAEHYQLFGFNVFPYESHLLDPQALLGSAALEGVQAFYRQIGFDADAIGESPDHVGVELAALAFLCGAEADAWQDALPAEATRMRHLQRRFLDKHLARWLMALVPAIRQQGQPFYSALAGLTLDVVSAHQSALEVGSETGATGFLPPPPSLLDDARVGLKEIAGYLLTPAYSGFYLSRDDIGRLARQHRLPRGFGSRGQMLTNLLRAAADYGQLEPLLVDLQALLEDWCAFYAVHLESTRPITAIAAAWRERIDTTQGLLNRLRVTTIQSLSFVPEGIL